MAELPKFPSINQELLSQLRGLFFSKEQSIVLPNYGFIGLSSIDTPSTLPPFPYRFIYVKADGYPYVLDYEGNEYRLTYNLLDDIKVSKLWKSDGEAVAWVNDTSGNMESQGGILDLDGIEDGVTLDADGDTSISAVVDDEIKVKIASNTTVTFNASLIDLANAIDLEVSSTSAPYSGSTTRVLRDLSHIADGGMPGNKYPASGNADDSEFNNSEQSQNNSIGTHAGGDFWEWSGAAANAVIINPANSASMLNCRISTSTTNTLVGDITQVTEDENASFQVCLAGVAGNEFDDWQFGIKLLDTTSGAYTNYLLSYGYYTAGTLNIRGFNYDGSSGSFEFNYDVGTSPFCFPIWLTLNRFQSGGGASCYWYLSYKPEGIRSYLFQAVTQVTAAKANYVPDELHLLFTNGNVSNRVAFMVDSVRRF